MLATHYIVEPDLVKRYFTFYLLATLYSHFIMSQENAVAIKLPTWPTQPSVWFLQAEAQFVIRNITNDTTKYHYVVSALDQSSACRLVDLLSHPPETDLYNTLKTRLTATFTLGCRERAERLLHMRGLGDRKTSQLMDEMLALMVAA